MTLQSSPGPPPRTCEYVRFYGPQGTKITDGIKFANQLTLRWGDYPVLLI